MRNRALAVVMAMGLSACGDAAAPPIAVEITSTSRALLTGLSFVTVRLHPGEVEPDVLLLSGPSFEAVYSMDVAVDGEQTGAEGTLFNIVEDDYTVDAWGFEGPNDVSSWGFGGTISVRDGQSSEVTIQLTALAELGG